MLPPLFVLPRDRELVVRYACAVAFECAYIVQRDQMQEKIGKRGGEVMAVESCLMLEKRVFEGRVGTNDPLSYRKLYIDTFNEVYPEAREEVLSGQLVIDPTWSEAERLAILYMYVERALAGRN